MKVEENQVKQQKFPSFSLFLMVHGLYTGVYRGRVSHTRAVHGRVFWACVCSSFPFSPVHGSYTGVCVGRVSHTRSIHGRVCWACVLVFFPNLIHGLRTRACVPSVCFPSFPKLSFFFPLTSICFVLCFLSSNCVQIFYKPS